MGRIIYSDGRTALTTTAFRYKLTDATGTLAKDWTTGATWTEEPAGTYYLDDAAAVPGTRYAVEPATGEVGGAGMVPWGKPAATGDAMTLTAAYDKAKDDVLTPLAVVDGLVDAIAADYAKTGEAATAVATLNDFDPATDVVAHVTLVDTTTTNTDMRGTDGAMLAASYTAPPTAAQNADAVWDEAVADHVTSGTFGRFLQRVYRYFFNKTLHTNTSMVVYADDGTTSDAVMAVSGDTSSVTKGAAS